MLQIFRTNQIFTSILLIIYIAILRFTIFFAPFKWTPNGGGVFSEALYNWIGSQEIVSHVAAFSFLLIQGFTINVLVMNHRLSSENNLFPGVFYILICSLFPDFLYLSPALMGNTFFLFALIELYATYKNPACSDRIFNSGFLTGMASLFYFPFLFFFLLLYVGLNILRAFNIREQLVCLSGIAVLYYLLGTGYYMFDQFDYFWDNQFVRNFNFFSFMKNYYEFGEYGKIGIFSVLILIAVFKYDSFLLKKSIQVQKKLSILYWGFGASILSALFQSTVTLDHFLTMAVPIGVILALTFTDLKPQWAEALHFLMVVIVIAVQLATWLL